MSGLTLGQVIRKNAVCFVVVFIRIALVASKSALVASKSSDVCLGSCVGATSGPEGELQEKLIQLRKLRNSKMVLGDDQRMQVMAEIVEETMNETYLNSAPGAARPGNFHYGKDNGYFVNAIMANHRHWTRDVVQSIVAAEWYHPGLTARSLWCNQNCGAQFPTAKLLDSNYEAIKKEVNEFWASPEAAIQLKGVGLHTSQFDKTIAGNGTWIDVRLWRGRAFNKHLCERYFRTICGIVEASPDIWTNPFSHVLLSVLAPNSWVPFHSGHTNGQLTYHLPVNLPGSEVGRAELAIVEEGGTLESVKDKRLTHKGEKIYTWHEGQTLVFDDSYTHAVRFRTSKKMKVPEKAEPSKARVVVLMRGWHPEFDSEEREAIREFVRRGGEENPEGYEFLQIDPSLWERQGPTAVK
eukprot:gnl/MRDRNA2_/MRDRNA2_102590_c0_seq1.p1 gnl/MRDRNA2_/MRDRNA2_102590_c0~~gnl/MRDRNA2_/MRDRNA2_102590_c0_seq1.p1  ORF type:complete len:430 (+),score=67.35 gnl/MRDRNA2_/MRDRNA2_102590_c0_seq1:62-1291(+)